MVIHALSRAGFSEVLRGGFGSFVAIGILAACASGVDATVSLGAYNVNPALVSVSGFSSGAFMAQQVGVAHSSRFMGVGVFAAGIYDCWRTVLPRAAHTRTRPTSREP